MQTAYNPKPIYDNAETNVISQNITCLSVSADLTLDTVFSPSQISFEICACSAAYFQQRIKNYIHHTRNSFLFIMNSKHNLKNLFLP
jgi:hypothetical protein